jgi:hypothetical protein
MRFHKSNHEKTKDWILNQIQNDDLIKGTERRTLLRYVIAIDPKLDQFCDEIMFLKLRGISPLKYPTV